MYIILFLLKLQPCALRAGGLRSVFMMADFDFVIPLNRDDLLHKAGVTNYVVDEVFPVRLLPGKLKGIHELMMLLLNFYLPMCCKILVLDHS